MSDNIDELLGRAVEMSQDQDVDSRPRSATDYVTLARDIAELVNRKQAAYGDSFGRSGAVLRVLFPDGINPSQYDEVLAIARVVDKLFRLANEPDAFGESPWRDIVGYGLLGAMRHEMAREAP